jgi:hypothetical protein
MSGQLHAPAALPTGKGLFGKEAGWAPEPGWMTRRREKFGPYRNSDPLVFQPIASRYNDYANPAHNINTVPGWRYLLGYNRLSHLIFHTLFSDHRRCYNRSITELSLQTNVYGDQPTTSC